MSHFDCIVVGGGIEGSCAAYSLVKSGRNTLLLEKFPIPHTRGSSHGASRIIRYSYPAYKPPVYQDIMPDAYAAWRQLEIESGEKLLTTTGMLWMGLKSNGNARSMAELLKRNNVPCDLYTAAQLRSRYPQLQYSDDYEALWDPGAGVLTADKCVAAVQNEFRKHGGVVHDCEPLQFLIPGKPCRVLTNKGKYTADTVVLCMGAWAGPFIKEQLGLDLKLTVEVLKVAYWKYLDSRQSVAQSFPCVCDDDFYGVPSHEYPGLFKFCPHSGYLSQPDSRDRMPSEVVNQQLHRAAQQLQRFYPKIEAKPSIVETCMYTISPSRHPYIDHHPAHENIIIAAGFSGHGFKLGPVVGDMITRLVQNRPPRYDMSLFKITPDLLIAAKL